jgi:hypothetical protein
VSLTPKPVDPDFKMAASLATGKVGCRVLINTNFSSIACQKQPRFSAEEFTYV